MTAAESEWKRALRGLAADGAPVADRRTPLGVQFEVREVVRRGSGRWQHTSNTTVAATAEAAGPLKLSARPVMPGRSGGWVGANLAWAGLQYQVHQLGLDREQVRWFTDFAALARASTGTFLGQDGVRIALDDFASALLWPLLDEARELGIAFVGAGREPVVRVGERAVVRLEATARDGAARGPSAAETTGLTLAPRVVIDRAEVTGQRLGVLGAHGLWAVEWPGPVVRLAPSERGVTAEVLRLAASVPIEVPPGERAEFVAEYLPRLTRSVSVVSPDASLDLPPAPEATGPGSPPVDEDAAGVRLEPEQVLPEDFLDAQPELEVTLVPTDDRDWLELGFVVRVDGREVPFSTLFEARVSGRTSLRLADGSYLRLNQPVFAKLMDLIAEADTLREWEGGPRIHRAQVGLWSEFEDLADESHAAEAWREQVRALTDAPTEAPPVPPALTADLREYQRAGFAWLAYLYDHGLGGILADDMGLGKTVQTLALMLHSRGGRLPAPSERGTLGVGARRRPTGSSPSAGLDPWLVVAPASVVGNWVTEAARFAPGLRVASVTRSQLRETQKLAELAAENDVIVMSYNLFRLDFDDVEDVHWAGLVLDEAQFVKNHRSRAHECAKALDVPFKLAVTGTPLENNVLELWAILDIVAPGLFPSVRRFTEHYVRPLSHVREPDALPAGISGADAQRVIARLRKRVRPFLLRRTKAVVAPELPAKQEQVLRVELSPRHRRIYEQFLQRERQKLLGLVQDDLDRQRFILFRSLTLLRMLALDPALIDDDYRGVRNAKLDALLEQLDDIAAEGHRALVFSQFTSFLAHVGQRLEQAGIAYDYLDGSTADRPRVIAGFKAGAAPVFLISLKAGGFGLNLTEADYVFLLDPWWNPASEAQAVDRTHRIGQASPVNVYRLVADGTIEDKVMKLRDEKAALFDQVLDDDGAFSSALSGTEIRGLLDL